MTNTWIERLEESLGRVGHRACLGLDPVLERIPSHGADTETAIVAFFDGILAGLARANRLPAVVKPNAAFYEQYGLPGHRALQRVIGIAHDLGILVLLDVKRGDIGRTAKAYARACFDQLGVDAVTLAPYMGRDTIDAFRSVGGTQRGLYVLIRTSNASATDLQDLQTQSGRPLYREAAAWLHRIDRELGAVVGATDPAAIGELADDLAGHPLLIPGFGAQGGRVSDVLPRLEAVQRKRALFSATSSIIYAHERFGGDAVEAAITAMKRLSDDAAF